MGLRERLGINHPVMDESGNLRCWNCQANLTGQQPRSPNQPIRCPGCGGKNFPDRRGSSPLFRNR
jgi:DNA-directed RNA polymerase subunit RPC12/RpoP